MWPDPEGEVRGMEFSPLYKSVPQAARRDARLYELLALVDAIRAGGGKAHDAAVRELRARLGVRRRAGFRDARAGGGGQTESTRQPWHARQPSYTAEDIEILEDLSPILHRPGMYTDPVNPNHALVEIIDNAADEGLAGFAGNVAVTLFEDGSAEVDRRRPRHPGRHPPEEEGAGGAGDLHHPAFGRQVPQDRQGRGLPHRRAVCTASASA